MQRRIYIENGGAQSPVQAEFIICFDPGLDPRSFARTKMSQCLVEPGYIVSSDGTSEVWKAAGVNEVEYPINSSADSPISFMRVWGPMLPGKRLDLLLEEINSKNESITSAKQTALQAVTAWIKAKMFLGETESALNPGAAFILDNAGTINGNVFFAPANLSTRCLYIEGLEADRYNCPDLQGLDAAAFCACVMLYKILTGVHPFPTADIYQDMREGVFMPVHLAAPQTDEKLSDLINSALLLPAAKNQTAKSGADILTEILQILLKTNSETIDVSMLSVTLSDERKIQLEKEKQNYLFKHKNITKTSRYVTRHKHLITGLSIAFFIIFIFTFSIIRTALQRPTTGGMTSVEVVFAYYNAFGSLDHIFMERCIQGADKGDINMVASFYAVSKVREAYEHTAAPLIISAEEWIKSGGELPAANVFGVTDLTFEQISGSEYEGLITYRVNYSLWMPYENLLTRSDVLRMKLDRRKNWRIAEILRTER